MEKFTAALSRKLHETRISYSLFYSCVTCDGSSSRSGLERADFCQELEKGSRGEMTSRDRSKKRCKGVK